MSAILFHFGEVYKRCSLYQQQDQNEGVVQYLTTQPGLTDLITMNTHDKIYWLISIFYWLLIGWRPMKTQAGLWNTQPHPHTGDNNQTASSWWCQHITKATTTAHWHTDKWTQMDVNPDANNMATQPNPTQPKQTKPTQTATEEEEPEGPGLP